MPVFQNHVVICNWNRRGEAVVHALRSISDQPIVILTSDIREAISQVGTLPNVFALSGDPTRRSDLLAADVAQAQSVLVLAVDSLGPSADARSVKVALMVENIQVTVYTIVELVDIRNKRHFSWTKVDDLITDQELSVRLFSQAVRHIALEAGDERELASAVTLLNVYRQFVTSEPDRAQLFRISCNWEAVSNRTFGDLLSWGVAAGMLPVALVGYLRHEIPARPGGSAWISWKTDVKPNPQADTPIQTLWPEWPEGFELGIIVLAKSFQDAVLLRETLRDERA